MALSPEGPRSLRRHSRLWPAEEVLVAYLAGFGAIVLIRGVRWPVTGELLAISAALAAMIVGVGRAATTTAQHRLRHLYLLLILPFVYGLIGVLNRASPTYTFDPLVQHWEAVLFGGQISQEWWQAQPSAFWSTVLHGAYFAFYPIVLIPTGYFAARNDWGAARRATLWVIGAFVVSYWCFALFPVAGPYYEFPRPDGTFVDNGMARLVYATLARGSSYGAAFPSSHVAAAWAATAAAYAGCRPLGHFLLVPCLLLSVGVVYTQMHYAVDALAGAGLAALVVLAGVWWESN
jgi:membrane-associated phospholipid phosphatase